MLSGVGDKNSQISLSRGVVLSHSTFHLVLCCVTDGCFVLDLVFNTKPRDWLRRTSPG